MAGNDKEREERLAAALRENLRKRKAQARILPGTGKGTTQCSEVVEGVGRAPKAPAVSSDELPPPRSGED